MLVYGDRARTIAPQAALNALKDDLAAISAAPPGLARHARLAGALIAAGGLAQGLADAAFAARGDRDGRDPASDLAQAITNDLAESLVVSWRSDFDILAAPAIEALDRLHAVTPTDLVEVRTCEGYAFYAVYPELYAEAAASLRPPPRVIGLRSIGTSLAAAAAAGCGARPPLTLRPCGDPFIREVRLSAPLAAELTAAAPGGWAIVDEGPGLSGGSFAAVGDLLAAHGVPADRIAYLPSHGGDPGPQANPQRRARWGAARKPLVAFEQAIAPRLAAWAEPLVGRAVAPIEDLSGGGWRANAPASLRDAPAWPEQERRKFLLTTEAGVFLLKFAGLGAEGEVKLARARALHTAGFTAEPIGLVHGFLVERWIDATSLNENVAPPRGKLIEHLGRYLAFRARRLPSPEPGATPDELRTMMVRNLDLAGVPETARLAATLGSPPPGASIAIDGRLHAWEWRVAPDGRLLKTDALDHGQAHDLIGAQDLAWDLAGAAVEFALSADEGETLRAGVAKEADAAVDPRRVDFATLAYLAFQIGWWRMAADGCEGARAAVEAGRYETLARRWRPCA